MDVLLMRRLFKCMLGRCCKVLHIFTVRVSSIAMSNPKVSSQSFLADLDILLDGVGNIKFSDFGAAKVFARHGKTKAGVTMARTNLNSMTGTPMYMSPEGMISLSCPDHSHYWLRQGATWRTRHLVPRMLYPGNGNRSKTLG